MHSQIAWPVDGMYQCLKCHEVYAVPWSAPGFQNLPSRSENRHKLAA
jgi:hypothetical protein